MTPGRRIATALTAIVATLGVIALLASHHPESSRAGVACGAAGLPEFPAATVTLQSYSGRPGDPVIGGLQNLDVADANHPAELYLSDDASLDHNVDTYLASGTIPMGGTSAVLTGTVPELPDGDYFVFACWKINGSENWRQKMAVDTFHLFHGTPTPSATPSASPTAETPTATATQTPSVSATPTAGPFEDLPMWAYNIMVPVFGPIESSADLYIGGLEVTQGIQCYDTTQGLVSCPDNGMQLVAGKSTAARVYIRMAGPGPDVASVQVRLHRFIDGHEEVLDTWAAAYHVGIHREKSDNADYYFNVDFPAGKTVQFYAEVDPENSYPEFNESNNRFPASGTKSFIFFPRRTFNVMGWRMRYNPPGATDTGYAGGTAVDGTGALVLNMIWPVANGGIHYRLHSGYIQWTTTIGKDEEGQVRDYAKGMTLLEAAMPWIDPQLLGQDRVHVWTPGSHFVRGISDPPFMSGGVGIASVGGDQLAVPWTLDRPGLGTANFVHELSHNTGLRHTNTGKGPLKTVEGKKIPCDNSEDPDTDWPYMLPSILEFGFNPITHRIYNPVTTFDIMSYCYAANDWWLSPFHWAQQFNLEGPPTSRVAALPSSQDVIAIIANIDNPDVDGDEGGSLGTLYKTNGGGNLLPPDGQGYSIELRSGDTVLSSQAFGVSFDPVETDGSGDGQSAIPSAMAAFTMPWSPGATSVVLLHGTQVLDTRAVSGAAPTVQVTSPATHVQWAAGTTQTLSWNGSDTDGDTLTYTVYFAHEGDLWEALATDITDTSYSIDVDSLAGGPNTKFRVVASDGVNTGYGDSATVSIANKPPIIDIASPADGSFAGEGDLVLLQGIATDLEDGPIDIEDLNWSSNIDGDLGTSSPLPVNTLSAGEHAITLSVTDSDGATGEKSIHITIGMPATLDVQPGEIDLDGAGDVIAYLSLRTGYPMNAINTSTLRVTINGVELTPTSIEQLGDVNLDGLSPLKLVLNGAQVRAALPDGPGQIEAQLNGKMSNNDDLYATDLIAAIAAGDTDCDGEGTAADVLGILAWVGDIGAPGCLFAADLNCDGIVDTFDAVNDLQSLAGGPVDTSGCAAADDTAAPAFVSSSGETHGGLGAILRLGWLAGLFVLPAAVIVRRRR